jgi:mono/diheme cytochrome c family protein
MVLIACTQSAFTFPVQQPAARRIPLYRMRQLDTDLEVTGMISGLPAGATGYVRYADLATLPKVTAGIHGDENFSGISETHSVRVTGVDLEAVAQALGVYRDSDLIDATCTDNYRAHYPASYIAAHHPILALAINGTQSKDWATQVHRQDPGPYFITHAHFEPAFTILAHTDRPQVPTNVVRLDFSTTSATFGAITPRANFSPASPEEQGFAIAKQNCLRCHNQGAYGGTKSGRTWTVLSTWAREQPAYFSAYVHDPKSFEPHAKMPGNPEYDAATLAALTAYFRTFTAPPAQGSH